jgi:hypothetical protein
MMMTLSHCHNNTKRNTRNAYDTESDDEDVRAACASIALTDNKKKAAASYDTESDDDDTHEDVVVLSTFPPRARMVVLEAGVRARAAIDAIVRRDAQFPDPRVGPADMDQLHICRAVLDAVLVDTAAAAAAAAPPPALKMVEVEEEAAVEALLARAVAHMDEMLVECEHHHHEVDVPGEHTLSGCARLARAHLERIMRAAPPPSTPSSSSLSSSSSGEEEPLEVLQLKRKRRAFSAAAAAAASASASAAASAAASADNNSSSTDDTIAHRVLARRRCLLLTVG